MKVDFSGPMYEALRMVLDDIEETASAIESEGSCEEEAKLEGLEIAAHTIRDHMERYRPGHGLDYEREASPRQ